MNGLSKRNTFREMMDLRDDMDRMLEGFFSSPRTGYPEWNLEMDVAETEDDYIVKATLPGVNPDDIDITFNNKVLTIKGEVKGDEEDKEARYHLRERWYGSFSRSISLPANVKADDIEASYDAGILTLRLPKTEEEKPHRITVQSGEGQKTIEGHFNNGKKK